MKDTCTFSAFDRLDRTPPANSKILPCQHFRECVHMIFSRRQFPSGIMNGSVGHTGDLRNHSFPEKNRFSHFNEGFQSNRASLMIPDQKKRLHETRKPSIARSCEVKDHKISASFSAGLPVCHSDQSNSRRGTGGTGDDLVYQPTPGQPCDGTPPWPGKGASAWAGCWRRPVPSKPRPKRPPTLPASAAAARRWAACAPNARDR